VDATPDLRIRTELLTGLSKIRARNHLPGAVEAAAMIPASFFDRHASMNVARSMLRTPRPNAHRGEVAGYRLPLVISGALTDQRGPIVTSIDARSPLFVVATANGGKMSCTFEPSDARMSTFPLLRSTSMISPVTT
jgi:hypothetical protein